MSRGHIPEIIGNYRSSSKDNTKESILHAALSFPLRSACAGHRHPLPTQDILWCTPGLTDSVNVLAALWRSFLALCHLSLTHSTVLLWYLHL